MGSYIFGFWEIYQAQQWRFAGDYVRDEEYGAELVPQNAMPESWGNFNFSKYYEVSGEKGLPDNLSPELREFMARHWPEPNRPSWMTGAEIQVFDEQDKDGRFAHLYLDPVLARYSVPASELRLIFWADQ